MSIGELCPETTTRPGTSDLDNMLQVYIATSLTQQVNVAASLHSPCPVWHCVTSIHARSVECAVQDDMSDMV